MRKDVYEEYIKTHTLKFFAFTERYHPDTGYADETSKHFEIEGGVIQKEFFNYSSSGKSPQQEPQNDCCHCPHGFYVPIAEQQNQLQEILAAFKDDIAE